jgi:8-amino-7-oxononanoate synthase
MKELEERLARIEALGRRRRMRDLGSAQGPEVILDGRSLISFSSNDYLGLANHPAIRAAAARALDQRGHGAGSARLLVGNFDLAGELEARLAAWVGTDEALLFGSGYLANLAVLPTLVERGDRVLSDRLNHASLVDGCRLSRGEVTVFPHLEVPDDLAPNDWVVTESIFSMDGDSPPLQSLEERCREAGAHLVIDEAHALGVAGPGGRGLAGRPFARVGTFGKAFGSYGAFVAGSAALIEVLRNSARSFIFTTGLPAPVLAASLAAVELAAGPEGDELRGGLRRRCEQLAAGLTELGIRASAETAIFPVVLGSEERALAVAGRLEDGGLLVQPIRPPTVPAGGCRLRIVVTAAHRASHVDQLLERLGRALAGAPSAGPAQAPGSRTGAAPGSSSK